MDVPSTRAPLAIRQPQFPMMMKWNPLSWKLLRSSVAPTVAKVCCAWMTWTLRAWAMEAATTVGGVVKGALKLALQPHLAENLL